jgi:hypothetical protein
MSPARPPAVTTTTFEVVEFRRYALRAGQHAALVTLFERELIETQESCGMVPFGHFRDLDDADTFVWLRGFSRADERRGALQAFYGSPAWTSHRDAANATMVDSDNVLLLRSARGGSGFDLRGLRRPAAAAAESHSPSLVAVTVFMLRAPADDVLVAAFEAALLPALRRHARRVAYLVTDERPNDFPRLPVREGEFAFVVAGVCSPGDALDAWRETVHGPWLPAPLRTRIASSETLRLEPAQRSLLR